MEKGDAPITYEEAHAVMKNFEEKLLQLADEHPEMFVPLEIED